MNSGLCNTVFMHFHWRPNIGNGHTDNSSVAHPITATQYVLENNGQNSWSMAQN
jgi:hypothetical protein